MSAGPVIDSYQWHGGREPMLRFGPPEGPVVVLALPLFEEANRTRAFGVGILRALASRGIGGVLPELPGQGESTTSTDSMRLADLRAAFAAAPGSHAVAIRSGALLVDNRLCWMLAPQEGPALLRELARVKGGALAGPQVEVAGNLLSGTFVGDLSAAFLPGERREEGGARIVRLSSDGRPADWKTDGPALWRRAEPDDDPVLAQILANDIAQWIAACAG